MAMTHTNVVRHRDVFAVLDDWIDSIRVNRKRAAAFRATFRELNVLGDRELNDIGLSRSDIVDIAHKVASEIN